MNQRNLLPKKSGRKMTRQKSLFSASATPSAAQLRRQGETGKQYGMSLAASARFEAIAKGQIALLQWLLESHDAKGTIDDATADLSARFSCGGKWRGSIPVGLSRRRIIFRIGDCKSDRPTRHRAYVSLWNWLVPKKLAKKFTD